MLEGQANNATQGSESKTGPIKQIIQELQNSLKNITNFIEQIEQGIAQNYNGKQQNELLLKLNGFNQLDDIQLNMLKNIDQQYSMLCQSIDSESYKIIKYAEKMQNWVNSQNKDFRFRDMFYFVAAMQQSEIQQDKSGLLQKIKDCKYNLVTQNQEEGDYDLLSSTISNDNQYIVSADKKSLKIWNYNNNTLIKSIQLDFRIGTVKFTDDSKLLYVGKWEVLYQFDVNDNFNETYKQAIHSDVILNIFCITNTIILTSSGDRDIIKTDVNLKQQLLIIRALFGIGQIYALDYNQNLNIIASSADRDIQLWDGNNGQLIFKEYHFEKIYQLIFIIKKNQLLSLHSTSRILIWNTDIQTNQFSLEQELKISSINNIFNISLVLDQQYITLVCREEIKIYSVKGYYIGSFKHDVREFYHSRDIQQHSMKAIMIKGKKILQICKVELDID